MEDCVRSILGKLETPACDAVRDQAQKLVLTWKSTGQEVFKDNASTWAVCAIYIATVHVKYGKGLPLSSGHVITDPLSFPTMSQLLHATDTNIKQFFEHMTKVDDLMGFNDTVKQSLLALKQKYLITYAIFCKFEKLYSKLFKSPYEVPCSSDGSCDISCDKRKICWLLFLLTKGSMLSECNELVLPLQLMLSCVDYILRRALPFTIREAYSLPCFDSETSSSPSSEGMASDRTLEIVCQEGGMGECVDEVAMVRRSFFLPFIDAIQKEDINQDVEAFPKLDYLESRYREMYSASGDIDELCLLNFDPTMTPDKGSQPASPMSPDSTVKSPLLLTPVRRAITTVQALKNLLAGASDTPSDVLIRYFNSCQLSPEAAIAQRVEKLRELFVGHYVGEVGVQASELACTRFTLGLRLYYRIMETMLIKEEKRLSTSDFSILLNNDAFHRSLLACALEVVMVTFGYTASPINPDAISALGNKLLFPWILDVFDLHAFNFLKVIESFIKNEPKLTEEAKKHLQGIETQIVECLAWAVVSPLFDALKALRGIEVNGSLTQSPKSNTASSTTAADMFLSPVRPGHYSRLRQNEATPPRHGTINVSPHAGYLSPRYLSPRPSPRSSPRPSPQHSPQQSPIRAGMVTPPDCPSPRPSHAGGLGMGPGGDKPGSVTLNKFFSKALQLAYHRLHTMCHLLGLSKELNRLMWTCLEHSISNKPWLMRGRHIDQIVMCCIYGVCKVRECELKFKDIVNMYRGLPHAASKTYRNVYVGADKEGVSIIAFYNDVFIPDMKDFIHKFQLSAPPSNLSPIPSRCQATASQAAPVYQVAGANLYISPMKDSPFKSPRPVTSVSSPSQMTPRTRNLYSFGETLSSERLRQFNEQVAGASGRTATTQRTQGTPVRKRIKLEELAGPEGDGDETGSGSQDDGADETDGVMLRRGVNGNRMTSMQRRVFQYASDTQSAAPAVKTEGVEGKKE